MDGLGASRRRAWPTSAQQLKGLRCAEPPPAPPLLPALPAELVTFSATLIRALDASDSWNSGIQQLSERYNVSGVSADQASACRRRAPLRWLLGRALTLMGLG